MRVQSTLVAALFVALASVAGAQQATSTSYAKVGEVHIGGSGAFDYLTVDPAG